PASLLAPPPPIQDCDSLVNLYLTRSRADGLRSAAPATRAISDAARGLAYAAARLYRCMRLLADALRASTNHEVSDDAGLDDGPSAVVDSDDADGDGNPALAALDADLLRLNAGTVGVVKALVKLDMQVVSAASMAAAAAGGPQSPRHHRQTSAEDSLAHHHRRLPRTTDRARLDRGHSAMLPPDATAGAAVHMSVRGPPVLHDRSTAAVVQLLPPDPAVHAALRRAVLELAADCRALIVSLREGPGGSGGSGGRGHRRRNSRLLADLVAAADARLQRMLATTWAEACAELAVAVRVVCVTAVPPSAPSAAAAGTLATGAPAVAVVRAGPAVADGPRNFGDTLDEAAAAAEACLRVVAASSSSSSSVGASLSVLPSPPPTSPSGMADALARLNRARATGASIGSDAMLDAVRRFLEV
ncbi:hypothetical protein HK405_010517, partial [Cladochytrium tenue]